jgi:hypothetical protein
LVVTLDPPAHALQVRDTLDLEQARPESDGSYRFELHAELEPHTTTPGWRLERVGPSSGGLDEGTVTRVQWSVQPSPGAPLSVELQYGGRIHHPLATQGEEYQRSFQETPGIIADEGVYLAGSSFWVPTFADTMITFDLEVREQQPPWDVVSQGHRTGHELTDTGLATTWTCAHPTEEIFLVAGRWHEFADTTGRVEARVFLRADDGALARRYLRATRRYLDMYEAMLTPFPYRSFSLVENFWETGYGMPGFTLLGSKVIRFPWIIASSYPHELLHNWWGNSVYVDIEQGNWCEGLTAYLADHLLAEQRGDGVSYRRATLKKFSDFVGDGTDIALTEFRSRHSGASEAVGYGKSLMLFHMVRRAVGDQNFLAALRRFANDHAFERASFADIAAAFASVAGGDWDPFFAAWTERPGAPRLEIASATARATPHGATPWIAELTVRQTQEEDPFPITVPVALSVEGSDRPLWVEVGSCGRECSIKVPTRDRPLRVHVDPMFDVMRRLDPLEVPPALSTLFGAADPLFVLPSSAPQEELERWRDLASAWARPDTPRTVIDDELDGLPEGAAWILGAHNRWAPDLVDRLADQPIAVTPTGIDLAGEPIPDVGSSWVVVARGRPDPSTAVGWVAAEPIDAIPGLARKLPHYTRYSHLAFRGSEPENVAKGLWAPVRSPLVRSFTADRADAGAALELPARDPLVGLPPAYDAGSLLSVAAELAAEEMEGRGLGSPGLARATRRVEQYLEETGLEPAGDLGFRQVWSWHGGEPARDMELVNLVGRRVGRSGPAKRPVLVMAHLDHLGRGWPDVRDGNRGAIHPGADDNASGVAVLLEVARAVAEDQPAPRPLLFAVTTGEEAGLLGAHRLLDELPEDELPMACVNLDTVGRLADGRLYVLRSDTAREWRHVFMGVGYTTGADVAIVAEPLDSSDQEACIARGIPAVQLFTGPHADYHRPGDTFDRLDAAGMATVTEAVHQVVTYLAGREEPLTVTIDDTPESTPAGPGPGRRASLGTMPDFAHQGPGVRVQQVMDGSAAAAAGLLSGDLIVAIDDTAVTDLRSFSAALKTHSPGATVRVHVLRDGEEIALLAVLGSR